MLKRPGASFAPRPRVPSVRRVETMKGPEDRKREPIQGDRAGEQVTLSLPPSASSAPGLLHSVDRPPDRAPRQTPKLGEQLGHFQVLSYLGEGGMGVVYAAEDQMLRRMVALKVLPDTGNADLRHRFLREARATSSLSHPNIAAVYEVGEERGFSFIAMELIRGQTLRARLLDQPADEPFLPVGEAVRVARAIARGLYKAHRHGIIHRDLKPENVMLGEDEQVKLLDFGLAKAIDRDADLDVGSTPLASGMSSIDGRVVGTPSYMSPEQAKATSVDARSDVFSFGVVLYEMLTGRRPFVGASTVEIFSAIDRDHPDPPSQSNPAVTPELEQVVLRCLHKEPDARYADAGEILDELDPPTLDALSSSETMRGRLRAFDTGPVPLQPPPTPPFTPEESSLWERWRRTLLAFSAAIAIAGAVFAWRRPPPPPPPPAPPLAMPLTDLPAPVSSSPAAVAAYRAGLRDRRLGNIQTSAFLTALSLDASLGAAHLQIASLAIYNIREVNRYHFRKAFELYGSLSPRDQALLEAIEPIVRRQPAEWAEAGRRMSTATERFPSDAQLWFKLGYITSITEGFEAGSRIIERSLALDPLYAEALAVRAEDLAYLGRFTEAHAAFDTCLRASFASELCHKHLLFLLESEGSCAQMESTARRQFAVGGSADTFHTLASALAAQGRPPATVREALRQGWAAAPAAGATQTELRQTISADLFAGEFEAAERNARQLLRAVELSQREDDHAWVALRLAQVLTETGRVQEAGRVAESFLSRRDAWEPDPRVDDFAVGADATPLLLAALRGAGKISRETFVSRRDQWAREWERRIAPPFRNYIWLHGYAATVSTLEDARDALSALTRYEPIPPYRIETLADAGVGFTYFLAGHTDEALNWLEQATRSCRALTFPVEYIRAHYWLGQAREARGDKPAACVAYQKVLERWGEAKPRSVTTDKSRERLQALGCPRSP
jgi:serine/threonine protein kinase/tetratricopeptide (TPR) repeat protein